MACSQVSEQGWGRLTYLTLPGGGRVGLYQPAHALVLVRGGSMNPATRVTNRNGTANSLTSH